MDLSQLHFAHPLWLWVGLAIPLIWAALFFLYRNETAIKEIEKFIDLHLIPHLLINQSNGKESKWKWFILWTCIWTCLTLAMAGPRWDFREIETFSRDQKLVILLDLSKSMNAQDIKPSRLVRAKQKIEDFINHAKGLKIGLVAFAADSHMITPITEDLETIRHLLPAIDTDLVYVQGSRLSPALDMATNMFKAEPGQNKSILIISDGGFEDASAISNIKKLAQSGISIYTMGVGTVEGAPMQDDQGNVLKKNGSPILSKLEKDKLIELSKVGQGKFFEGDHSNPAERTLLRDFEQRSELQKEEGKTNRLWDEGFYYFLIPIFPLILIWFRRRALFGVCVLFLTGTLQGDISTYFMNSEEIGQLALENTDYNTAIESFQDPYRKGVACYKAGKFAEAEIFFQNSTRLEVDSQAGYNLGNALVQQQKLKEAITAYEKVLEKWPEHTKAKENLELVKKMLENQQQDQQNQEDQQSDQNQDDKEDKQDSEKKQDKQDQQSDQDQDDKEDKKDPKENNHQQEQDDKHDQNEKKEQNAPQNDLAPEEVPNNSKPAKSQEDQDADLWLDQISNDPKTFLKNKFYLESSRNGTTEGIDPW